ncbi:Abi-alpha family protein [uncultured Tenacibaculum sp.]|uniref:Abi-alpha family protein n=1 Tax=uncultured Tenacibaculum sp. TaxID=174713 RepID=UPI002635EB67|nr:Abi-alpha family protein [uncultured Tenacibaculum sp.]
MKEKELTGIGQASEKALNFVEKIIASPLIEVTGVLTDKVEFWRFKNKVNIILKAKEFLKEKGIETPKRIPVKDLFTLLEYSSYEENDFMKDSWGRLLSNSLDPQNKFDSNNIFIQILNHLSCDEIILLESINKEISTQRALSFFNKKKIIEEMKGIDPEVQLILLDNLVRLRLIEIKNSDLIIGSGLMSYIYESPYEIYLITKLGESLLKKINS